MMNIPNLLITGLIASFLFCYTALLLFYHNPRYCFYMLPKIYYTGAEPTTRQEKRTYSLFFGIMIVFILLGCAVSMAYAYRNTGISFWTRFWHGYLIFMIISLMDAIFMDIIIVPLFMKKRMASAGGVEARLYNFKKFFVNHILPEHFLIAPIFMCPFVGFFLSGSSLLIEKLI